MDFRKKIPLLRQVSAAIFVCISLIFVQSFYYPANMQLGDSRVYLSIAKDIADKGVYTDGEFNSKAVVQGEDGQGMFFAPLYPAFVSLFLETDEKFYKGASCFLNKDTPSESCPSGFNDLYIAQMFLAAFTSFIIWISAWVITRSYAVAWLSLLISCATGAYVFYMPRIMTEILAFPLFALSNLFLVLSYRYKGKVLWTMTGVLFALAALTRPSFAYLFYAVLLVPFLQKSAFKTALSCAAFLLLGYGLVAGSWMARNYLSMGSLSLSKGYAPFILVQRTAYNDMTLQEWGASFIYGLPDFGDKLAAYFFDPENYERFDYGNPEGFYAIGNNISNQEMFEKAGTPENYMPWLIKEKILPDLPSHILASISLAWRGMWVGKYWGLVTIPAFFFALLWAIRRRWAEFIIFSFPPWFMLGFHAFTSVNVVRYNLILIPCLSIGLSFALYMAFKKLADNRNKSGPQ